MIIFQTVHKYGPHIPLFEKKYGVTDVIDFETLRRLLVADGYCSTYILQPALEHKPEQVFYTLWNYERLQQCWAREHSLKTNDLNEIKLAQIEEYRPDVFYNFSAFCDGNFIKRLGKRKDRKDIYWNAYITAEAMTFPEYDGQISLHRPFVYHWQRSGLSACELQPGIPVAWATQSDSPKSIDILFYGQYLKGIFDNRNHLVESLLRYKLDTKYELRCHLTYTEHRPTIFRIPKLPWTRIRAPFITFPSKFVRQHSLCPLYGDTLYHAIAQSRIVVNAYGNFNQCYKSNMRLYEAIGLGAFLISEEGTYPDGFEPGVDFYTYRDAKELITQIERVLSDWPKHAALAQKTREKITGLYSKERQWNEFLRFAESL